MIQRMAFGAAAALSLAACATSPAPVYGPQTASRPPSPPNAYTYAPRAPVHSQLLVCNGGASNAGPIGPRGESLAYTPYLATPAGAILRNPTEGACLSSGFGWRGTATGGGRQHTGIDLANRSGGFIYAAADGWISTADWRGGYGLQVEIDHGDGVRTSYAHLSEVDPNLRTGMFVPAGAPIGRMGMTGNATGVHLHYEITVDGVKVDPLNYGAAPIG